MHELERVEIEPGRTCLWKASALPGIGAAVVMSNTQRLNTSKGGAIAPVSAWLTRTDRREADADVEASDGEGSSGSVMLSAGVETVSAMLGRRRRGREGVACEGTATGGTKRRGRGADVQRRRRRGGGVGKDRRERLSVSRWKLDARVLDCWCKPGLD